MTKRPLDNPLKEYLVITNISLEKSLDEYHALRQQFESAGHELSEKARQIIEYAMAPADPESRLPQFMLG